jgi:hypothetical protein
VHLVSIDHCQSGYVAIAKLKKIPSCILSYPTLLRFRSPNVEPNNEIQTSNAESTKIEDATNNGIYDNTSKKTEQEKDNLKDGDKESPPVVL